MTDVVALRRAFDYAVPDSWHADGRAALLRVGSMVRSDLHGRRVAGWVVALDPDDGPDIELRPLTRISGEGPAPDIVELASWAAWRWAGSQAMFLSTASPPTMVARIPAPRPAAVPSRPDDELVLEAFSAGASVRVPPLGDRWPFVLGAVAQGNALVLVPSQDQARVLAGRLARLGVATALHPRDWAVGAAGATVVGGRAAAFASVADLRAILVIDDHDRVYEAERAPTWNARDVAIERARRSGVPCVCTSPMPSLEAQAALPRLAVSRADERAGWPHVQVVDPRLDDDARGTLWSAPVVRALHTEGRVAVVVNRKGRSRILVCTACDRLAVCDRCDSALRLDADGDELRCRTHDHRRPVVCAACGATRFKQLRIGVTRAREELAALLREPVSEVTADTEPGDLGTARVIVGTEAVLHRLDRCDVVVFADFDQELVAPRHRAAEDALAMLVRAGRLVGGRRRATAHDPDAAPRGRLVVQTRQPDHPVLVAARTADVARWSQGETARRRLLRYPPYAAIAHVSGPGAAEYVARLGSPSGIEAQGPADGEWLIRAQDPSTLSDALALVERPKERVRVAVDSTRA